MVLHDVVESSWSKEEKLVELKTELSALERQIQLSISSKEENREISVGQQMQSEGDKEIDGTSPKIKL